MNNTNMATLNPILSDFELHQPKQQHFPVVFNSPHSGRNYPTDFIAASNLNEKALRSSEDFLVDELFAGIPALSCPLLKANFPRAFLDVNREPWELDPKMFSDKLPGFVTTNSIRIAGGLGTIARKVSERQNIYRDKLTFEHAQTRINRYYFPYHAALKQCIKDTHKKFGQVLLIDCHSMPSSVGGFFSRQKIKPDIILGDRFGASCEGQFVDRLENLFSRAGLNVARNRPYAGGYITAQYGRPHRAVHAIQVEINRGLYMNEKTLTRAQGFDKLQNQLTNVFATFMAEAFPSTALAAE